MNESIGSPNSSNVVWPSSLFEPVIAASWRVGLQQCYQNMWFLLRCAMGIRTVLVVPAFLASQLVEFLRTYFKWRAASGNRQSGGTMIAYEIRVGTRATFSPAGLFGRLLSRLSLPSVPILRGNRVGISNGCLRHSIVCVGVETVCRQVRWL